MPEPLMQIIMHQKAWASGWSITANKWYRSENKGPRSNSAKLTTNWERKRDQCKRAIEVAFEIHRRCLKVKSFTNKHLKLLKFYREDQRAVRWDR